jgi:hypothetical protein
MAGVQGLSQTAQAGLKEALAGQSAPPNPQTPKSRADDSETTLLDLQRVRRALDVAQEHLDDTDPRALLIGGMHSCVMRLLSRIELSDAVDVLLERLFPLSSQTLKQRLQTMYAPISPPTGLGGGAQPPGSAPGANASAAGGATGQPPGGGLTAPAGDAGVESALPA